MSTSVLRRAVTTAAGLLLAALLPWSISSPAAADGNEGTPGVVRADETALSAGDGFACAIVSDGSLRCWGRNDVGQLAQGNTQDIGDSPGESTVPVDLGPGRTAVAVAAGGFHTCAILDIGLVRCWGNGSSGQLGNGSTTAIGDQPGEGPVAVDLGGQPAVAIAAGEQNTCAILASGQLRCWGLGGQGALAQGNTANIGDDPGEIPVPVNLGGHQAVAISIGTDHLCAILDDGSLHCWGANGFGELGRGGTSPYGNGPGETSPPSVTLPAGRKAVAVSAGGRYVCAVLDDGQLRCWGRNLEGTLGQGSTTDYGKNPGESTLGVDIDTPVRSVTAGTFVTCAVSASGLRCWGSNTHGELGQGTGVSFYGRAFGETPAHLPPVNLGGLRVGRDVDGDGVRDAVDACPTVPGTLANGCAAPAEAVLKGKKVIIDSVLAKRKASAKCPAKAEVTVKTNSKHGRIKVTKQLKTKTVATGCLVKGKVKLPAKPKKSAKVKVTVSGKKLTTKRLIAVRP